MQAQPWPSGERSGGCCTLQGRQPSSAVTPSALSSPGARALASVLAVFPWRPGPRLCPLCLPLAPGPSPLSALSSPGTLALASVLAVFPWCLSSAPLWPQVLKALEAARSVVFSLLRGPDIRSSGQNDVFSDCIELSH